MLKKEKGSSLLEVIIALTVLSVILLSLIPVFANVARNTAFAKQRTVGYNLAVQELEKIKSLEYDEVGLVGGNPNGVVTADKDIPKDGISYHARTRIRWKDDPDDSLSPTDQDPRDYKLATVDVTWSQSGLNKSVSVSTIITRQSFDQISTGGNIKVIAKDNDQLLVEDTKVNITTGPSSPITDYTDEMGESFFAMLSPSEAEGDYSVAVEKNGYVVHPQMQVLTTTVSNNETRILEFLLDRPGFLAVDLVDDETGQPIDEPSHLTLNFSGTTIDLDDPDGVFTTQSLFPGIWEVTGSSSTHESSSPQTVEISRNNTESLTIRLTKKQKGNLHLQVFDNSTQDAIPDASVAITNVSSGEVINTTTNIQGILEIQLIQAEYDVEVSKSGYTTQTQRVVIDHPGNTHVDMYLNPTVTLGSILVRTIGYDNLPRPNILVRVAGPSYDRQAYTDSNGEAVFANLNAGRYTVYRRSWGWRFPRAVQVRDGIQSTVIYRF